MDNSRPTACPPPVVRAGPGAVLIALAALAACAGSSGSPPAVEPRQGTAADTSSAGSAGAVVAPVADYHQHLMSPGLVELWSDPVLPAVELPDALDRVLRTRERLAGTSGGGEIYTEDAQVVELSPWVANWIRGRSAIGDLVSRVRPGARFVPNGYGVDESWAWIATTVVRGEGGSARGVANLLFVLRRDAAGTWRIAAESASLKPLSITAPVTADQLVARLDEAGIRQAVVLSGAYGFATGSPAAPDEQARVRAENDWTAAQVAGYPDRLVGFCGLNPLRDYAVAELEHCASALRLRGLKLHLGNSGVDVRNPAHVEQLRQVFRTANRLRLPITIHLRTPDPTYGREHSLIFLEQILPDAPDVPVQVAHLAGTSPGYSSDEAMAPLAEAVAAGDPRTRSLYFDLAGNVTPAISAESAQLIARRIRQVGTERILFGSDVDPASSPRREWGTFRGMIPLTDEEFRAIADNRLPYLPVPPAAAPLPRTGSTTRPGAIPPRAPSSQRIRGSPRPSEQALVKRPTELLFRRAAQMLLEPPHRGGIDTLEIGASEAVPRAFNANERRGHARPDQRRVHRLPLDDRDGLVGVAMHDERRSSAGRDETNG